MKRIATLGAAPNAASKRLAVRRDRRFCYDIVYTDGFDSLWPELCLAGVKADGTALPAAEAVPNTSSCRWHRAALITDSNVAPLYAEAVRELLAGHGLDVSVYILPAGEENKTLDHIREIYRFLIEKHFDRRSLLIALGGGVVGDMTGYAAATFLRGVDFIQIPTTLLAQADSSIGGKTGVDFDGYKNMVGAFYMPRLVYTNVSVLQSLDARQFSGGFAEVMKHGLIRSAEYYEWLIDQSYEILDRDSGTLLDMLYESNQIKRRIVEADPLEKKDRMLLNFGHTLGHAIEKYSRFTLTHGECVALGCVAASYISWKKGFLPMEEYYEIRDMFVPFGLPISAEKLDTEQVLRLVRSDKKNLDGALSFILLRRVGRAFVSQEVTDDDMRAALQEISYREEGE
ncbi:3-dehydroquinate synthase [Lachnoclostridium sp. Marseille-P6806]|uniref:3-dehydroquinate synthase n=1 Tax=Lachnoclostridium sp. Marseille-P6806 TaxID=2364793 RepID=UPI00102FFA72|nr:3-dehydroquinate synthase [Lachnoclostridium sp. Marseille-P6806]